MLKFKLTIAYDGSAWRGWQSQKSGLGVQDRIESALSGLFGGEPRLTSSSRTDAGVHARGLVAHFEIPGEAFRMPVRHLALAINSLLPEDIRVVSATRSAASFDARFDATGKQYRYHVWNHPVMNPLRRHDAWQVPRPLDLQLMKQAASNLIGRRDFRAFTSNRGGGLADSVRTLTRCEVRRQGPLVTILIEGSGFLYKMCRGIAGTLVQVGEGRFPADEIPRMLESRDRRLAGINAPAKGLVLWKVLYRDRPRSLK